MHCQNVSKTLRKLLLNNDHPSIATTVLGIGVQRVVVVHSYLQNYTNLALDITKLEALKGPQSCQGPVCQKGNSKETKFPPKIATVPIYFTVLKMFQPSWNLAQRICLVVAFTICLVGFGWQCHDQVFKFFKVRLIGSFIKSYIFALHSIVN